MKRLIVVALIFPLAAFAQYKCVDNGKTLYSERPCSANAVDMNPQRASPASKEPATTRSDTISPDRKLARDEELQKVDRYSMAQPEHQGGAGGWVIIFFGLFAYFIPAINALLRHHRDKLAIGALNLFLGWTFIGWVVALVWSYKTQPSATAVPNSQTHTQCPDCAEIVLRAAKVCKHCGRKLLAT